MARANYYYDALQKRIEDLRYEPIKGWQSYPGFISRHFDQRFRSMRSTGERYVDVGERIERLFALYGQTRSTLRAVVTSLLAATSLATSISAAAYSIFLDEYPSGRTIAFALFLFVGTLGSFAVYSLQDRIDRRKYLRYVAVFLALLVAVGAAAAISELLSGDLLKGFVQRISAAYIQLRGPP
jgi:uncharacterized membrane-anchored protein